MLSSVSTTTTTKGFKKSKLKVEIHISLCFERLNFSVKKLFPGNSPHHESQKIMWMSHKSHAVFRHVNRHFVGIQ
jgi:hypothetical protein